MVKALVFKGDKKPKKRKRTDTTTHDNDADESNPQALVKADTAVTAAAPTTEPNAGDVVVVDDNSWVSATLTTDISGPVLLVLSSDTPSTLSTDSQGSIFPLEVENHDGSGDPNSAEPHDVRQVWVATRIAGTEGFSFKGHHGRYLGCDQFGVLRAAREAVGSEEQFIVVPVSGDVGGFAVQTSRETFLSVEEGKKGTSTIRGDGEGIEFRSTLRIRMQARFKPKLKVAKEEKAREKISRKELEGMVGRKLDDEQVKSLKRARREGNFHEALLDVKVKGKHDKFA